MSEANAMPGLRLYDGVRLDRRRGAARPHRRSGGAGRARPLCCRRLPSYRRRCRRTRRSKASCLGSTPRRRDRPARICVCSRVERDCDAAHADRTRTSDDFHRRRARAQTPRQGAEAQSSRGGRHHHRRNSRRRARRQERRRPDVVRLHHPDHRRRDAGRRRHAADPAGRRRISRRHQAGHRARADPAASRRARRYARARRDHRRRRRDRACSRPAARDRDGSQTPAIARCRSARIIISSRSTRRWISTAPLRSACGSTFRPAPPCASSRARAKRSRWSVSAAGANCPASTR